MDPYAVSHFSHRALLLDLKTSVAHERTSTAVVLSRIAEVEDRRLYLPEGYPSMYAFCVQELHYAEGAAYKRLYAARAARRFPALLVALAEGRLHLSGVVMLSAHLTSANADERPPRTRPKPRSRSCWLCGSPGRICRNGCGPSPRPRRYCRSPPRPGTNFPRGQLIPPLPRPTRRPRSRWTDCPRGKLTPRAPG